MSTKNSIELCWMCDNKNRLPKELAPIDCLHCNRDIPHEFDYTFLDKETFAFIDGYRFAMFEMTVYILTQNLDEEDKISMLGGILKRFTCGIDRGMRYKYLTCALNEMSRMVRQEDIFTLVKAFSTSERLPK